MIESKTCIGIKPQILCFNHISILILFSAWIMKEMVFVPHWINWQQVRNPDVALSRILSSVYPNLSIASLSLPSQDFLSQSSLLFVFSRRLREVRDSLAI